MGTLIAEAEDYGCGSVTECLNRAKLGESFAQHQLWERYLHRLLGLARRRLRGLVDAMTDPDDVASVVFNDFLQGLVHSRFRKMKDRDDLWQVLVMLTRRNSINELRRANALKRKSVQDTPLQTDGAGEWLSSVVATEPTPEEAVLLTEEFDRRLSLLSDDKLRTIALSKMSGFSNQEISDQLDCSTRSVERKLSIIRRRWTNNS